MCVQSRVLVPLERWSHFKSLVIWCECWVPHCFPLQEWQVLWTIEPSPQARLCLFLPLPSLSAACVFLIIRNFQPLLIRLWIFWVSCSQMACLQNFSFLFHWICFVLKHSNYWSMVNFRHKCDDATHHQCCSTLYLLEQKSLIWYI